MVLFLDEVDALCPNRSQAGLHEARVVGQLLTLLDGASTFQSKLPPPPPPGVPQRETSPQAPSPIAPWGPVATPTLLRVGQPQGPRGAIVGALILSY